MWSAGAGVEHKPPTDIVWKSQSSWGEGGNSNTTLHNSAGDVSIMLLHFPAALLTSIRYSLFIYCTDHCHIHSKERAAANSGTVAGSSYSSSYSSSSEGQQEHLFHKEVSRAVESS